MKQRFPLQALAAAASLLLLSACGALAPKNERPAAPVAQAWPVSPAVAAGAQGQAAAELPWQSFYGQDARLRELIKLALENNRDLRVALLNVEQARALARVADAARLPTVGVGLAASRQPDSTGKSVNNYQAGLQITSYEIDLFGRVKNQSDAAMARYLATAEGGRAAQISLVSGLASAYLAWVADGEMVKLGEGTLATRAESLRLIRLKYEAGAASALDLAAAESAHAAGLAALAQARRAQAQDENALALLLGQPLPAALPAGRNLAAQSLADVPAGLPSEVLVNRPDVLQAEAQLMAANANIGAARAAFFPSILLTSNFGTASSALSDLFKNSVWTLSGQALLPIFDAGRNRANLDAAKAAQGIALAQYEKAVQQAFREVADGLAGRATFTEQLQAQAAQTRAENERLRLVDLRYNNGASSSLELLDAQRASFAAEQALVQVRLAALLNGVNLYKALGGGVELKAADGKS
ncbi:multidrug efflux system outer membrane protein [Paucibacter oligotrophus]|uniref:Multidrug efflux system outer membrane protein n=1 Tax=Roseateles oligotrophus TaxID=1769250 RepID=A0A840LCI8_9BURK|nr:efflux transporter outer membrane subunit [Roseateles oligotrophus]MBB4844625.1 multidrug efflux system outer membrane protein [Roseateles oligotrophus]